MLSDQLLLTSLANTAGMVLFIGGVGGNCALPNAPLTAVNCLFGDSNLAMARFNLSSAANLCETNEKLPEPILQELRVDGGSSSSEERPAVDADGEAEGDGGTVESAEWHNHASISSNTTSARFMSAFIDSRKCRNRNRSLSKGSTLGGSLSARLCTDLHVSPRGDL